MHALLLLRRLGCSEAAGRASCRQFGCADQWLCRSSSSIAAAAAALHPAD
jgi:hypothetical protein